MAFQVINETYVGFLSLPTNENKLLLLKTAIPPAWWIPRIWRLNSAADIQDVDLVLESDLTDSYDER